MVEPTHLKNISQIGNLPQIGVKIPKTIWNHHLENQSSQGIHGDKLRYADPDLAESLHSSLAPYASGFDRYPNDAP